jgi:hypothetical protein
VASSNRGPSMTVLARHHVSFAGVEVQVASACDGRALAMPSPVKSPGENTLVGRRF